MPTLKEFLDSKERTSDNPAIFGGPFGTKVHEMIKKGLVDPNVDGACGLSALQSPLRNNEHPHRLSGIEALIDISSQYQSAVSPELTYLAVTPTFRCDSVTISKKAPGELETLFDRGVDLSVNSIEASGRAKKNSLVIASVGPPFDCYKPELTPVNVLELYLPQTLAAINNEKVNGLLFETTPSMGAIRGAMWAYSHAVFGHLNGFEHSIGKASGKNAIYAGNNAAYDQDPRSKRDKGYIVSICLDKDGLVGGISLDEAIKTIDTEALAFPSDMGEPGRRLIAPSGYGINCNSYELVRDALKGLSEQSRARVVSFHVNGHPEKDCRKYDHVHSSENHSPNKLADWSKELHDAYPNLRIIGGCCGTDERYLSRLSGLFEGKIPAGAGSAKEYWPTSAQVPLLGQPIQPRASSLAPPQPFSLSSSYGIGGNREPGSHTPLLLPQY